MKNKILAISVLCIMVLFVLASCSSPASTPAPTTSGGEATIGGTSSSLDGAAIMQQACTQCHGLAAIYSTQTDEAGWTQIVENMIARGAVLTADQKTALITYLAANY